MFVEKFVMVQHYPRNIFNIELFLNYGSLENDQILSEVFGNDQFCLENGRWPTVIFTSAT